MLCPIAGVSIFSVFFFACPLVGGNPLPEHSDEITLLQAAVNAKFSETILAQPRVPVCSEPKVDSSAVHNLETTDKDSTAPESLESDPSCRLQVHLQQGMGKAEPAPALVLSLRAILLLLSIGFFTNGAMRWFPSDSTRGIGKAAHVNAAADAVVVARQCSELQAAALVGDDMLCESLLKEAPEVLAVADAWGTTALHAAATSGAQVAVALFLEHGAPVDPIDAWDETPLHLAAREGHVNVCELLAKNGASLRAVNADDWTPLVVAANAGQEAVCTKLLALGAGVEGLSEEDLPDMLRELIVAEVMAKVSRPAAN